MAKGQQMPVTPALIKWARNRAGFTLDEATEKFSHIADWESGDASPTYAQLERLADEFKLPIAVFFFPEPPALPPIRESFRTLPDAEFEHIPRHVRFLLRKGKAYQLNLAEMTQGRNPAPRLITRDLQFAETISVDVMAARVRDYLGVPLATQYAWEDGDTALKEWRRALTDSGVFVFKDPFRVDGYSGFSLYDNTFPIIYVNNSSTKTRQIFTLFHELAHLLFRTSGIDTLEDSYIASLPAEPKRLEILCNRFAARFLVPTAALTESLSGHTPTPETAALLADRFHVSREVIYRAFLDRQLIDSAEYARAAAEWKQQQQAAGSGGDYYWSKISYLGRDYIALAFNQYHHNRINERQLAEYLDIKPKNLVGLEEYFSKSGQ